MTISHASIQKDSSDFNFSFTGIYDTVVRFKNTFVTLSQLNKCQ